MATTWQWLERMAYALHNSLNGNGGVPDAEALYVKTTGLLDDDIDDPAFPRAKVRAALVEAELQAIALICRTSGHPRRHDFKQELTVEHLDTLPDSLSPHETFLVMVAGEQQFLKPRRFPSEVIELRLDPGSLRGVADYYYATHGNTFYTNAPDDAVITEIYYFAERVADHPNDLAALFNSDTPAMRAPDELAPAIVYMAVAQSALSAAAYQSQSAGLLALAMRIFEEQGIDVAQIKQQ